MNIAAGAQLTRRYQIISKLGQGGFGKTFLAQDLHLPGNRKCVVKQLKPQATDRLTWKTAKRLFDTEAQTLHQLGTHPQIPQLYAYFEEEREFYLVEEYIKGSELHQELSRFREKNQEHQVTTLLQEILEILEFVHQNNVIHRDINPRNIIRRQQDGKLFLIDFGAVKQITSEILPGGKTKYTIAIGTPGYRPSEQANGKPKLSSDIYAVGAIGIQALTGRLPHTLPTDPHTGEISWQARGRVSPELVRVLNTMLRYDFRQRYQSATEALAALRSLTKVTGATSNVATATVPVVAVAAKPLEKRNWLGSCLSKILILLTITGVGAIGFISVNYWRNSAKAADLYNQGQTLYESKRYQEALESYDRAVEILPNYEEAWLAQGDALQNLQRYREALNAYEQAIKIKPDYWSAWMGRAQVLEALGEYQQAIAAFRAAIDIQSDRWQAWQGLANLQMQLKQYSQAVESFDRLLQLQPQTSAWYQRGWALHKLGDYQDALESYDKALEIEPDRYRFWYQRGNALMNLKRYQEAVKSYQQAVQYQPNFYPAWYSQGMALSYLKNYRRAIAAYDRVIKIKADHYEAWYHRGWAFHQLKRYHDAIASYDRATECQPNYYQAWYNRGNSYYNLREYQQAISSYDRAVKLQPNYPQAWYSRGNALLKLKRYKRANASYEKALSYKPDYRQARRGRIRSHRLFEILGDRVD